jgi:dolichol-phosphate mannosyltransferase
VSRRPDVPEVSLVLPTYNERANLPVVVDRVRRSLDTAGISFELVVVDDDSPDETWKLAEAMGDGDPRIRVVRRRGERGLATAVVAGWRHARGRLLAVMDADLQYRPESLPAMVRAFDDPGVDVAIGSRYAPGATVQEWSVKRWAISLGARLIARLALPDALGAVLDPGAGYFMVRREVIAGLELQPRGFKILIEVLARSRYEGVVEIGQQYEGRKEGQSKLRGRQVLEYLSHLTDLSRATGEAARSVQYAVAGASGVIANLAILGALTGPPGLGVLAAGAIAAEAAIVTTFVWREALAPRPAGSAARPGSGLARLGAWHVARWPGGAVGVAVLWALTALGGLPVMRAGLVGVAVNAVVNHLAGARLRRPRPTRALEPMPRVGPTSVPIN